MKPFLLAAFVIASTALAQESAESMFRAAQQLEREGKESRAIEKYQAFLEAHPEHSQRLEAHFGLAKCLDSTGRVDEAISHFEACLAEKNARFRSRSDALFALGKLHFSMAAYEPASKVLALLLKEGAGLYEDEALHMAGVAYAVQKKYDEAGATFNVLKRRDSQYAERAASKLAHVWLEAGNLDLAVEAVSDLAQRFPQNKQARSLMLRIADRFRNARKFDQAVAICEQLRRQFKSSSEGQGATFVLALVYRDRGQLDDAVSLLSAAAKMPENRSAGIGAEAMLEAAEIHFTKTLDAETAMGYYEEALSLARENLANMGEGERLERVRQVFERAAFRLAEHYFAKEQWQVALEYYTMLRAAGTSLNVLPRIMKCQAMLDMDLNASVRNESEVAYLKAKIAQNPGSYAAAEGEVFLLDRELNDPRRGGNFGPLAEQYAELLIRYPATILNTDHLASYIHIQIGRCHSLLFDAQKRRGQTPEAWKPAVAAFEQAIAVDPDTPYQVEALQHIARIADQAEQKDVAFSAYRRLYELTQAKLDDGGALSAQEESDFVHYVRAMLSRADGQNKNTVDEALALAQRIAEQQGVSSAAARHAALYVGDLYTMRADFEAAIRSYKSFIAIYGPPPDDKGDIENAPWKPEPVDESVQQLYDAAVRIAQAWYMRGHTQNMVEAYEWMARNFPHQNRHMAEANYWLAIELGKGEAGQSKDRMRAQADAFWQGVVHPSLDFGAEDFDANYHFWLSDPNSRRYVQAAALKAGELYSALETHDLAAGVFREYLRLFPPQRDRRAGDPPAPEDDKYAIARYALGREYIALGDTEALGEVYKQYAFGLRDERFRVSALQLLGYHATRDNYPEFAVLAYATILDEYGPNVLNAKGEPMPLPNDQRIRSNSQNWNGIRMPAPAGLDLGEMRFSLGFFYWQQEEWGACARTLKPFLEDAALRQNASRDRALYMIAQSHFNQESHEAGLATLKQLIEEHPGFEAAEEAYVKGARAALTLAEWQTIRSLHTRFLETFANSAHRPHMDLCGAVATLFQGDADAARRQLDNLARGDTYQDVKADAHFYLGLDVLMRDKRAYKGGLEHFSRSVELYPRAKACLEAGRCCMGLQRWEDARNYLDRVTRDFPRVSRDTIDEAKELIPKVLREIAKLQ
jgi:tetratricopeptide (TPR) repeat protein